MSDPDNAVQQGAPSLRKGVLGLPEVLMTAISHMAPAVALVMSVGFITLTAGIVSPLAFALAFIIMLGLALNMSQLAKHLPSAGGLFTYVSASVGPRSGLLVAWNFMAYEPIGAAINFSWLSFTLTGLLDAWYGIYIPWWVFFLAGTALTFVVMRTGIGLSGKVVLILTAFEVAVVLALGATGVANPGDGGVNLESFNPANATSMSALFLAVVFSLFSFTGFETVAPLAEETANPRRNIPRALVWAVCIMGVFFVLSSWMMVTGWGTNDLAGIAASDNPVWDLADRLWGAGKLILLLAVVNSVVAVAIAASTSASRVFYSLGRIGAAPASLAKIDPKRSTPVNAINLQTIITLAFGLFFGFFLLKENTLFFFGLVITFSLTVIYLLVNLGVFRYYRQERPSEFKVFNHAVLPIFVSVMLLVVCVFSAQGATEAPLTLALPVSIIWLALGIVVTLVLSRDSNSRWLKDASKIYEGE